MQPWRTWESASESVWETALKREAVIRPPVGSPEESVEDAASRLSESCTLIYRLVGRYRKRPQTSSLLPAKRRPYTPYRTAVDFGKRFKYSAIATVYDSSAGKRAASQNSTI